MATTETPRGSVWACAVPVRGWNGEPPISELLDDPITRLIMARDRLRVEDVSSLMTSMRLRLQEALDG